MQKRLKFRIKYICTAKPLLNNNMYYKTLILISIDS